MIYAKRNDGETNEKLIFFAVINSSSPSSKSIRAWIHSEISFWVQLRSSRFPVMNKLDSSIGT